MAPLARQSQQIDKSELYKDGLTPKVTMETNSDSLQFDINAVRTQIKNILGEDNWYDPPKISIKTLYESVNRLWYRIEGDTGFTEPTSIQDTLGIKGVSEISTVAADGGNDTLTISYSKNVYKTIQTDAGSLVANDAQDRLFIIGGDEISVTVGVDEVTITFAGADPQDYWDLIVAATSEASSYPTGTWTTSSPRPNVQQDTLIITGSNGITTRADAVASPESDTIVFVSQDFTDGSGTSEFDTIIITSLDQHEIVYSDASDYLRGDLTGLNYQEASTSMGINISSLSHELHIDGDMKIHDSTLDDVLNSTTYDNGTFVLAQNGYIILFRNEGTTLFNVFDEYSVGTPTLKFSATQPSEKRYVKGAAIRGNYLITVSDPQSGNIDTTLGYFDVWDITDFESPTLVASISDTDFKGALNFEVHGRYAFFGSQQRLANIIDLLDVESPVIAYQTPLSGVTSGSLHVRKNDLFFINNGSLDAYDISNLPSGITYDTTTSFGLQYNDQIRSFGGSTLFIVRASGSSIWTLTYVNGTFSPASALVVSGLQNPATASLISGNRLYVTSGSGASEAISAYSINETGNATLTLLYTHSIPNTGAQNISAAGNKIYISGTSRFRVVEEKWAKLTAGFVSNAKFGELDIRNRMQVTDTLSVNGGLWVGPGGLHVDEGYGISTDSNLNIKNQLLINTYSGDAGIEVHSGDIWVSARDHYADYSNFESEVIFNYAGGTNNHGLFHKGSIIRFGEQVVSRLSKNGNISESLNSVKIGSTSVSADIKGDYLFIAPDEDDDIVVVNLKGDFEIVGSVSSGNSTAKFIKIVNNIAIVAHSDTTTVRAYDISNPERPVQVATLSVSGTGLTGAVAIDAEDNYVYVAYGASNPNFGVVAIINVVATSARNFTINQIGTSTFTLATRVPYAIKAYRDNLIVVPENQGAMYVYDTQNKNSATLIATKTIRAGTPHFAGRYLWCISSGIIRAHDYITALEDLSQDVKYVFVSQNGGTDTTMATVLADGNSYYVFDSTRIIRYKMSHAQFDTMSVGALVSDEVQVRQNLSVRNSINAQEVSVGEKGLRVKDDLRSFGYSSFFGKVAVGTGTTENQFHIKNSGIIIENQSGLITNENNTIDVSSSIPLKTDLISAAGGYVATGDVGADEIGISDIRFDHYSSAEIGNVITTGGNLETISMRGDLLFAHVDTSELEVYSVSRKTANTTYTLLSNNSTGRTYSGSLVFGNYLILWYDNDAGSRLDAYDITDPTNPIAFSENAISGGLGGLKRVVQYKNFLVAAYRKLSGDSTVVVYTLDSNGTLTTIDSIDTADNGDIDLISSIDVSRDYAYLLTVDTIHQIVSLDLSDLTGGTGIQYISSTALSSSTYQQVINVKGKYAIITASDGSSDQVTIFDVSDPSSMVEITDDLIIADGVYSIDFAGSKITIGSDARAVDVVDFLGYRGQRGQIGNVSVEDLSVAEDVRILNDASFYSNVFIGQGGVHVDQGNGIGTDGRLITTGKVSFGHTDLSDYDLSIKGEIEIVPNSFAYGSEIYDYSFNSQTGYLFAHNGVLYPLLKSAWTNAVTVTGKQRFVSLQTFTSAPLATGFDKINNAISVSSKYLFKLDLQDENIRIYDFENFRESATPVATIDYSTSDELPLAITTSGNILYVLSGELDLTPRVIAYRHRIENDTFVIEKISELVVTNMVNPYSVVYHKGKLYIGDNDSSAELMTVVDVTNPSNMVQLDGTITALSATATVESICASGESIHILYFSSGSFGYLKVSDTAKNDVYVQEEINSSLGLTQPRKIIAFGRYVAIWDYIAAGDDKVFILDTESSGAPVVSTLTNADIPTIEDIIFYRDAIYVLGTEKLYPIEIYGANVTNADLGSLSTGFLTSRNAEFKEGLAIRGGAYVPSSFNSRGIGKVEGSAYVGKRFAIGSTDRIDELGFYIYGKDLFQEVTTISYVGSDSLDANKTGGIAFTNHYIYQFNEDDGAGVQFRREAVNGSRDLGNDGDFTITGLINSRYIAAENGYVYSLNSSSELYCLSHNDQDFDILSQIPSPSSSIYKTPTGLKVRGGTAVAVYDDQITVYDVSDPRNIQGGFWIETTTSNSIKEVEFYGSQIQVLEEEFSALVSSQVYTFQYIYWYNSDLKGVSSTSSANYISLVYLAIAGANAGGFGRPILSAHRDGDIIYGVRDDGILSAGRLTNSQSVVTILSSISLFDTSPSEVKIARYGENLIVASDIGMALVSIQDRSVPVRQDLVTNSTSGYTVDTPFGSSFDLKVIGNSIYYIRNSVIYEMALKKGSITHVEAGSLSVVNFMSNSNIDIGEDAMIGSVFAGGSLSVPSILGVTTDSLVANRISINRTGVDTNGYRESDWSLEIVSGETVGASSQLESYDNITDIFNDGSYPRVMVPVGEEVFVFAGNGPTFSILSKLSTTTPEVVLNGATKTVDIDGMTNTGVIAAFSVGRKVYAVNSTDYAVFEIDAYTRTQRNMSKTLPFASGLKNYFVVGSHLYWATGNSVNRYIVDGESIIDNGSFSNSVEVIAYGEGKVFVIHSNPIVVISTEAAGDVYDGTAVDTLATGIAATSIVHAQYYRNKLYLLSVNGGVGTLGVSQIAEDGTIGAFSTVFSTADIAAAITFKVFEDRIYVFKDDATESVLAYDYSGNQLYYLSAGFDAIQVLFFKNKVLLCDNQSNYLVHYGFNYSNLSIGELGSVTAGALECLSSAEFMQAGYFRNGLSVANGVFSYKQIHASKGFGGQAFLSVNRNSDANVTGPASTHVTNLPDQTVDLYYENSAGTSYIDEIVKTIDSAFDENEGESGIVVNIGGVYQIKFSGSIYRAVSGTIELHLSVNNQSAQSHTFYVENTANTDGTHISCTFVETLEVGDVIKLVGVRSSSGASPMTFKANSVLHVEKIS